MKETGIWPSSLRSSSPSAEEEFEDDHVSVDAIHSYKCLLYMSCILIGLLI